MIYRRRSLVDPPAVLTSQRAINERNDAVQYYSATPPPQKSMTFSVYKDKAVKERLTELFGRKCAYCETTIAAGADYDVEHFRPKGGVVDEQGNTLTIGYWFLASRMD